MRIVINTSDDLVIKEGNITRNVFLALAINLFLILMFYENLSSPILTSLILFGCVMNVVGIFLYTSITVEIQRKTGRILLRKKRVIGEKIKVYKIADVFYVETINGHWMEGDSLGLQEVSLPLQSKTSQSIFFASGRESQSILVFKDGREVPFDHRKTSSTRSVTGAMTFWGNKGKEAVIAREVAMFLGVPFRKTLNKIYRPTFPKE